MANSGIKLVYFGNERLVSGLQHTDAPILRRLIRDGYVIAAIVANYTPSASRSNRELEVAQIANEHGIPLLTPKRPADIADELKRVGAEAAVLVAYGRIIPQSVIDLFAKGIINVHPSLLPVYRGPTPIESAIANGDSETGISVMQLSAGMDEGPVYAQVRLAISPYENKFELYDRIAEASAELLSDSLPAILDGSMTAKAQDGSLATYSHLFTNDDKRLDPVTQTAGQAERVVRANAGYPKSTLELYGQTVVVRASHVGTSDMGGCNVAFKDGTHLIIDELTGPSGKLMTGAEFVRNYKKD